MKPRRAPQRTGPNAGPNTGPTAGPAQQAAALLQRGRPADAIAIAERAAARDTRNGSLQQVLALAKSALTYGQVPEGVDPKSIGATEEREYVEPASALAAPREVPASKV